MSERSLRLRDALFLTFRVRFDRSAVLPLERSRSDASPNRFLCSSDRSGAPRLRSRSCEAPSAM